MFLLVIFSFWVPSFGSFFRFLLSVPSLGSFSGLLLFFSRFLGSFQFGHPALARTHLNSNVTSDCFLSVFSLIRLARPTGGPSERHSPSQSQLSVKSSRTASPPYSCSSPPVFLQIAFFRRAFPSKTAPAESKNDLQGDLQADLPNDLHIFIGQFWNAERERGRPSIMPRSEIFLDSLESASIFFEFQRSDAHLIGRFSGHNPPAPID